MLSRLLAYRRYRRMQRLLSELDRADERARSGSGPGPRAGRSGWGTRLYLVGLLAVIAAVVAVRVWLPEFALGAHRPSDDSVRGPAPAASGPYAFMNTTASGRPVTYSSCAPLRYVINSAGMPPEVPPLIRQAARDIGAASGLTFTDEGATFEPPSPDRAPQQPDRYGRQWAPILVAWADHPEGPEAPGRGTDTFGIGGSTFITVAGRPESTRYVTGEVTLFARALTPLLDSRDGPTKVRAVITHELGHVVGLAHVNDRNELMTPTYTGLSGLGPGDRAGLRLLGHGPCVADG